MAEAPTTPTPTSDTPVPVLETPAPLSATPTAPAETPAPKPTAADLYAPDGGPKVEEAASPEIPPAQPEAEGGAESPPKPEGDTPPIDPDANAPAELTAASYSELKVPDAIRADAALVDGFKDLAVAQKIAPEAAQALLDYYTEVTTKVQAAQIEAWTTTQAQWKSELDAMPELQGDRRAQTENLLGQAITEFGDASVREALNTTGLGNHPGLVRLIYNMASRLVEDSPHPQGRPTGTPPSRRTPAEIMYGDAPKPN